MRRFLLRLAPVALMGYPVWVYSDHFEGLDRSIEWRLHTYEARSLAERIARHACCPPDAGLLASDVDAFAGMTADNPAQVARAAEFRAALDPLDPARVARLAEAAIAEEDGLLPGRVAASRAKQAETRRVAVIGYLVGCAVLVIQAFADFVIRATDPGVRRSPPHPSHPVGVRPGGGR